MYILYNMFISSKANLFWTFRLNSYHFFRDEHEGTLRLRTNILLSTQVSWSEACQVRRYSTKCIRGVARS